jgi:hypothetical protein
MKNKFLLSLSAIYFLAVLVGCEKKSEENNPSFDRSEMLRHLADNMIVPAYERLKLSLDSLQTAANQFVATPTESTLITVQNQWKRAYIVWQQANGYNFGPAGEQGLRRGLIEEIGTFPINETKMQTILSSGTYNLQDFNRDARGFLAVEYLLFDFSDNNTTILNSFSSTVRKTYLTDLIADITSRVSGVLTEWKGSYRGEFLNNNGTDVGSSTSVLYNEFVKSFETIKNFKVGLPLGLRPGQSRPEPTLVEAYYSGFSVESFRAHVLSCEAIWYGRAQNGTEGPGFKAYLESVTGGPTLVTSTINQLSVVKSAMNEVPTTSRLSVQIQNSPAALDKFHTELQKHTRFFKSDMSSLLGIAITFSSGDGD